MSQADNTMFNAMTNEQDMFGDPKEGDLLESIDRNSTQIRHVCAAIVGGVIGAGISSQYDVGPGGAELIPVAGAGIAVIMLGVRDRLVQIWDDFK